MTSDPQHHVCGWPASLHDHSDDGPWTVCPDPPRKLCGSCDAGLPMSCTCVPPPATVRNALAEGLRHDVAREFDSLFRDANCRTPRECARLASAILGREVGPGRNAIRPGEIRPLIRGLRDAIAEAKGHDA